MLLQLIIIDLKRFLSVSNQFVLKFPHNHVNFISRVIRNLVSVVWCLTTLSLYIVQVSFICGGNRNNPRKSPTCRKPLTNFST